MIGETGSENGSENGHLIVLGLDVKDIKVTRRSSSCCLIVALIPLTRIGNGPRNWRISGGVTLSRRSSIWISE